MNGELFAPEGKIGRYLTEDQCRVTARTAKTGGGCILGTVFVRDAAWLTADAAPKALIECASVRRFGLILSEPHRFDIPIPAKGFQGIFRFTTASEPKEQP